MTEWTPKLEALIREVGEYTETQMKDLLNPKASTAASAMRIVFRGVASGQSLMKKTCSEAGWEFKMNWMGDLKKLVEIAEQNGSDAGEKIKKALPIADQLSKEYTANGGGILKQVKTAKQKNIQY